MENTSSSCSNKSIPCGSNACADDIIVVHENQTTDSSVPQAQEHSTNEEKSTALTVKPMKSEVWKDFHREVFEGSNSVKATCKHCLRIFNGATSLGTTHLKNHIKVCPKNISNKRLSGQQILTTKMSPNKPFKLASWKFDQNRTRM